MVALFRRNQGRSGWTEEGVVSANAVENGECLSKIKDLHPRRTMLRRAIIARAQAPIYRIVRQRKSTPLVCWSTYSSKYCSPGTETVRATARNPEQHTISGVVVQSNIEDADRE